MEIIGVYAVFANGNRREMTGLAPAHARRQYAAWLAWADVVETKLIYREAVEIARSMLERI